MEELSITTNDQLLKIAKQLNVSISFIGHIEELDEKLLLGFSIINLGDAHWALLYVSELQILYLDPLGDPPNSRIIELACERPFNYSKKQVQYCSIWPLLFANVISKAIIGKKNIHKAINDFLNQFDTVELVAISNKSLIELAKEL